MILKFLMTCFNSSLVRLGGFWLQSLTLILLGFNSSLVRLGGHYSGICSILLMSFNSSLVRLGVKNCSDLLYINKFQFQLGAIGSLKANIPNRNFLRFQFQLGAIGSVSMMFMFIYFS